MFNSLFTITSNIERISDHAMNIAGYSKIISDKKIIFSVQANAELSEMKNVCVELFEVLETKNLEAVEAHEKISCLEQRIDDMTIQFRDNMYERIQNGKCSDEGSILFSEMLTDFERIGDHALNISNEMLKIAMLDN